MLDASSMPQLSVSYTLRTIDGDDRRERWAKSSSGGLRVRSGRLQGQVSKVDRHGRDRAEAEWPIGRTVSELFGRAPEDRTRLLPPAALANDVMS